MITTAADPFITLEEAKRHLRMDGLRPDDDTKLDGFIAAACATVVRLVGQVSPVTAEETVTVQRDGRALLSHRPVISITSPSGWSLVNPEGIADAGSGGGSGEVAVVYQAGRDPVPGNIRLAALELVAHLWRGSQHANGAGGRPGMGNEPVTIPGIAYALPYRVRELLGLGKPMTDEPLV